MGEGTNAKKGARTKIREDSEGLRKGIKEKKEEKLV